MLTIAILIEFTTQHHYNLWLHTCTHAKTSANMSHVNQCHFNRFYYTTLLWPLIDIRAKTSSNMSFPVLILFVFKFYPLLSHAIKCSQELNTWILILIHSLDHLIFFILLNKVHVIGNKRIYYFGPLSSVCSFLSFCMQLTELPKKTVPAKFAWFLQILSLPKSKRHLG